MHVCVGAGVSLSEGTRAGPVFDTGLICKSSDELRADSSTLAQVEAMVLNAHTSCRLQGPLVERQPQGAFLWTSGLQDTSIWHLSFGVSDSCLKSCGWSLQKTNRKLCHCPQKSKYYLGTIIAIGIMSLSSED